MRLYHVTTSEAAASIRAEGFRDGVGAYMLEDFELRGVWFSDYPLTANEGAWGDTTLAIEIDEEAVAEFELIEEGKHFREWCIPAEIVNRCRLQAVEAAGE